MQSKESRWDLSLKGKENEADAYQPGCCCSETGLSLGDCFIMTTRLVSLPLRLLRFSALRLHAFQRLGALLKPIDSLITLLWYNIFWYFVLNKVCFAQQLVIAATYYGMMMFAMT